MVRCLRPFFDLVKLGLERDWEFWLVGGSILIGGGTFGVSLGESLGESLGVILGVTW